jgi:hypothetical protein
MTHEAPPMRLPRARFTIRWMMSIAGVVAGALAITRSFEVYVHRSPFATSTAIFIDPLSLGLAMLSVAFFLLLVLKTPSKNRNH